MSFYTNPNQKVIHIHREPLNSNYLGVNNNNWKAAARSLNAHAFKLYMYLASNKDDFNLALSPAAIQAEIGMARSTYYDQLKVLESMGYLFHRKGNIYEFYEIPQSALKTLQNACVSESSTKEKNPATDIPCPNLGSKNPPATREIYITVPTNISTDKPEESKEKSSNHSKYQESGESGFTF
jgi:hypothetical protein